MNGGAHDDHFPIASVADIFRIDHFVIPLRVQLSRGRPEKRSPAVRIASPPASIPSCFRLWWLGAELIAPNVQHQPRFTRRARSDSPENFLITIRLSTQSAGEASVCMHLFCPGRFEGYSFPLASSFDENPFVPVYSKPRFPSSCLLMIDLY